VKHLITATVELPPIPEGHELRVNPQPGQPFCDPKATHQFHAVPIRWTPLQPDKWPISTLYLARKQTFAEYLSTIPEMQAFAKLRSNPNRESLKIALQGPSQIHLTGATSFGHSILLDLPKPTEFPFGSVAFLRGGAYHNP
jgi:hypothetical protein